MSLGSQKRSPGSDFRGFCDATYSGWKAPTTSWTLPTGQLRNEHDEELHGGLTIEQGDARPGAANDVALRSAGTGWRDDAVGNERHHVCVKDIDEAILSAVSTNAGARQITGRWSSDIEPIEQDTAIASHASSTGARHTDHELWTIVGIAVDVRYR